MTESKQYRIFIPNQKFWNVWREKKEAMKFLGVGVTKVFGKFYVLMPGGFKMASLKEAEEFC